MNRQLDFLDVITLASFLISLQNLDLNVSAEDIAITSNKIVERLENDINAIHGHLASQDKKIDFLIDRLENIYGDK